MEKGLTIPELAEASNKSKNLIIKIEQGDKNKLTARNLNPISNILELDLNKVYRTADEFSMDSPLTKEDLDPNCDLQDDSDTIDQIANKEKIFELFPDDPTDRQILELCLQGKNPTNKQISELPGINLTPRGVGKRREWIRKRIDQHHNHPK